MAVRADASRALVLTAWNAMGVGDWGAMDQYFSPEFKRHTARRDYNRDELRVALAESSHAFETQGYELTQVVAEGDRVAFRWLVTAIHRHAYLAIPPTHRLVTVSGLTISRVEADVIVEDWASWDRMGLLEGLGIVSLDSR
jgi:predicted ester cyclase